MSNLPAIVSRYKTFLRFFGLIHIALSIFIFLQPGRWLDLVNLVPNQIHILKAIDASVAQYWVVCSAAYAWAVGILFLFAAHNSLHSSWGFAIIFSKLGGSLGFGYLFYKGEEYFAYALTPLIDLVFILMIFGYLVRTSVAQRRIESFNSMASNATPEPFQSGSPAFKFERHLNQPVTSLAEDTDPELTPSEPSPSQRKPSSTE